MCAPVLKPFQSWQRADPTDPQEISFLTEPHPGRITSWSVSPGDTRIMAVGDDKGNVYLVRFQDIEGYRQETVGVVSSPSRPSSGSAT